MKKFTALLVVLIFALSVFPITAKASSASITHDGTYDISTFGNDTVLTIGAGLNVVLTNDSNVFYDNFQIKCPGGLTHLATVNVNIKSGTEADCPALSFSGPGNLLTIGYPGSSFSSSGSQNAAGIHVTDDASLIITGSGMLYAWGGPNGAGIGGNCLGCGGNIEITGDDFSVYATGGKNAAGIGNGALRYSGNISIKGGVYVNAVGGKQGAGIGGASISCSIDDTDNYIKALDEVNTSASITIEGEDTEVIATGGCEASGIGSGDCIFDIDPGESPKTVFIKGATVKATGGEYGAGIGLGDYGLGESVTIEDAYIEAHGGDSAAGIGTGYQSYSEYEVKITGSEVYAYGAEDGAGVGGGDDTPPLSVYIESSYIEAVGGGYAAGIGSGDCARGDTDVTIIGSEISSYGGIGGAGIGTGVKSKRASINITNSNITASGASIHLTWYLLGGAGIGTGGRSQGAEITITGGTINATGGANSAGIGGGYDPYALDPSLGVEDGIDITIDNAHVTAIGGVYYSNEKGGAGIGQGGTNSTQSSFDCNIFIRGDRTDIRAIGGGDPDSNIVFAPGTELPSGELWLNGGAGIGGGYNSNAANITISAGTILAESGKGAAAIGGGNGSEPIKLTIEGGFILADGNSQGQDIGDVSGEQYPPVLTIGGDSIIFLRNDSCSPEPETDHIHMTLAQSDEDGHFMGVDLPKGWDNLGVYYKDSKYINYDANGALGTVPEPEHVADIPTVFIEVDYPNDLSFPDRSFVSWCDDSLGEGARYLPGNYYNVPIRYYALCDMVGYRGHIY